MKIPKVIHYCWFGENQISEEYKKCILSWKKNCPDYKIIEWNEKNFNLNINDYVKEAYKAKKWAFVSDYARLYVLYYYGGIYLDTDVEIIKPLDPFLDNEAFSGFESDSSISTGIMASVKGFKLFKEFLDYYENKHFINDNGTYDLTTNVVTITNICRKYGLRTNNSYQIIDGWTLYPNDYFSPKDFSTGLLKLTDNSVTIHHFAGSWMNKEDRNKKHIKNKLCNKFGKKLGLLIYYIFFSPYIIFTNVKNKKFLSLLENINKKERK